MTPFASSLDELGRSGDPIRLPDLTSALAAIDVDASTREALRIHDARHPYGRRVVLETPFVESMVATWNPAFPCAPHDHGGSIGGVKVLQGVARHRLWRIREGKLQLALEELRGVGDVLTCGPDLVHSMGCAGAGEPLMTLHLYSGPIGHMVVYDRATQSTYVVDGGCGAWVPLDQPELIVAHYEGILSVAEVMRRLGRAA